MIVLRIGKLLRNPFPFGTPFTRRQLIEQSDIWFNRVITFRESMPRSIPPSENYVKAKGDKDGTYTLWGWDRQSDLAYVQAIWQKGLNQRVSLFSCIILI